MKKQLKVNQVSLYREIAKNLVNPLEVIREAISNSHDASAKEIMIKIDINPQTNKIIIEISDDGNGMDDKGFERFFNLGDSQKLQNLIGQKGLGTKTYFRSGNITVESQSNDKRYKATLSTPWDTLNKNILPEYEFNEIEYIPGKGGTFITVEDYKIDKPERYYNFDTLKDYILWFTAAGSFKTKFAEYIQLHKYVQNMQIAPKIILSDKLTDKEEEIAGGHQFSPPNENPSINPTEESNPRSNDFCRHFGPFHRETTINDKYISFQLYGTISGINCRKAISKLKWGETFKSRFGLYLCKDFIPVVNRSDLLKEDNYHHYHLLLNSQNFELTADRNNLSNDDSPEIKWIFEEFDKIVSDQIKAISNQTYFRIRKEEESAFAQKEKLKELIKRKLNYNNIPDLNNCDLPIIKKPDNEAQLTILFSGLLSKYGDKYFSGLKIGHYSARSTTDLICIDKNNNLVLVELEYKLSNLFKQGHPFDTFDYVICWEVDLEINETEKTPEGKTLKLVKDKNNWILKYGPSKIIPILEIKSIIDEINHDKNNLKNITR